MTSEDANRRPDEPISPEAAEVDRLRTQVAALRDQLDTQGKRHRRVFAVRRVLAAILVAVAGFGAVSSAIGLWGARTTLDTDRWVATVDTLPQDPAITAAMSTYLTTEVFDVLNVRQRLTEALPPRAAFLAAPVTNAVRDYMRGTVQEFMRGERFQELWVNANRFAHARIVAVLENRSETVSVEGGTVTLNLLPVVNGLLVTLEAQLPTLFGKRLDLPTLTSGEIPPGLHQRIETALGVTLPSDFAQIKLYNRDRLGRLQDAVVTFKHSVGLLIAGTVAALGLALWISPSRRRTVLQLGLWLTVAVLVLSNVLRAVRDQLLTQVPAGVYRDGVSAAMYEMFADLRQWGDWILWTGVVVAVPAYLVGPGRLPVALRRHVAQGARWTVGTARRVATGAATSTGLRTWSARHVDVLRVGGIVVAAIVALLFSSWAALLVVAAVLAGYEVLVTLLARWGEATVSAPAGQDAAGEDTGAGTAPGATEVNAARP